MIKSNLEQIRERLTRAASKRGVSPGEITLVAVTKTVPVDVIGVAHALGINDFGENRVQEALTKIEFLPPDIRWHFIGHLQTNKVRIVLPVFDLIHSLDSIKLAGVIEKEGKKNNKKVNVLLQVNIGAEESKYGFKQEEVSDALGELADYRNLKVLGLMAVAPFLPDPEEVRPYFRQLYRIFKNVKIPGIEMKYLSMGMSNDFEVAVEEGANVVRLGSALFGERS
ncbi:MAG: YggS family pyridoxal phosphate-dependent enzyme [Dethiobacter sp.]|nr:MAG: YggS family pyridoxal phosphate-dependent enzyme [Dethiobacter sp.]